MMRWSAAAILFLGCHAFQPKDMAADFSRCEKLSVTPNSWNRGELTKCLVDRFGWGIDEASRGADSTIRFWTRYSDSVMAAVKDSVDSTAAVRARMSQLSIDSANRAWREGLARKLLQKARRDSIGRAYTDSLMILKGQAMLVADKDGQFYFWNSPLCAPVEHIPEERRAYFLTTEAALTAGFQPSTILNCHWDH